MAVQGIYSRGFYLGGAKAPKSDPAFNAEEDVSPYLVGSFLSFDEKNETFRNTSTTGLNEDGTVVSGFLSIIESLGARGVLVAFGGITNTIASAMSLRDGDLKDPMLRWPMQNISIYDIASQKWYQQQATGDIPSWRYLGCSVAISAPDNSSHSIYVYGGWGATNTQKNDGNVYVLSIPSFKWIRVTRDTDQRSRHQCHLMGNNHMVVVGGIQPNNDNIQPGGPIGCDIESKFAQGLGIFFLNDHSWRTEYDPAEGSGSYRVHSSIYKVIGGNETGGSTKQTPTKGFSSQALQRLLGVEDEAKPEPGSGPRPKPSSNNMTSIGDNSPETSSIGSSSTSKKTKNLTTPAIVGIVVGIVAVVSILSALTYFMFRRRRTRREELLRKRPSSPRPMLQRFYSELDATPTAQEMYSSEKEDKLARQYWAYEMTGSLDGHPDKPLPLRPANEEKIVLRNGSDSGAEQPGLNSENRDQWKGSELHLSSESLPFPNTKQNHVMNRNT
ncbi:MAG: hypothetical protein LQ351_003015 [Letrouitia transgressa]|nr:MAG: hypothetical protein LQ351_003015 [Letrouitia transgressa]